MMSRRPPPMAQITIKIPNPKCRQFWCLIDDDDHHHSCLIEFIDWRYSKSCWYFRPLLWITAPLQPSHWFASPLPPPVPCVNKWIKRYVILQCVTGGGGGGIGLCGEHRQELHTAYLTRVLNLQNCLPPQRASDRQSPAARSLYRSIFKKSRHLGFGVFIVIWSMPPPPPPASPRHFRLIGGYLHIYSTCMMKSM